MEDFLKFILIAGVILIGIFKEVKKNQAKKAESKPRVPTRATTPATPEVAPSAIPVPETWGKTIFGEIFEPLPTKSTASKPVTTHTIPNKNKKKEISVESSLANSVAQDARNLKDSASHDALAQLGEKEMQDFTISSAEEARRAIIWGEVLRRKY